MFESLTRKHAVFCFPPSEVELNDVLSTIGNIVGSHNIRAACRMNKKFVVFVSEEHVVVTIVEHGLFIEPNTYLSVFALQAPTVEITITNIPPFPRNQDLCNQLNRFGKVVWRISMVPMCNVSDKFKHVMSFKRVVYMILPENEKTQCRTKCKNRRFLI